MKKSIFILFSMLFVFPQIVFAYSPTTTHVGLTEQIVEFYNLIYPADKISYIEKELIISGAVLEDTPVLRALNHFYDPIRNIGVNGGFTSKEWALDESIGLNEYTWQKAIDSYVIGDKEKALIALGHTLHLIEDASVPDHTRNDPHIGEDTVTNASPFEDWAHLTKTRTTLRGMARGFFDDGSQFLKKGGLGEYFDFVARYSNGNFFSRDTIKNDIYQYANPKVVSIEGDYAYGIDSITKKKHILLRKFVSEDGEDFFGIWDETDSDTSVLSSYFDRLSKQAVLAGAGVVELFFRTANVARAEYLEQERLEQEEEERRVAALAEELSSKGIFGLIWRGVGFLVMDNVVTPVVRLARVGGGVMKGLGRAGKAGARNIKNAIVMGGFSVNTAGAIGLSTAKEKVGEISEDVRDGVSTVKTFVQRALNREVAGGGGNAVLVLDSLNTQNNIEQQVSQDEINKLFEILANASNDLEKIENGVEVLSEANNDIPVVIVTQSANGTQSSENGQELSNLKQKTSRYVMRSYSAGFGGGGGGTPTQESYTNSANQTQEQQETSGSATDIEEDDEVDDNNEENSSESNESVDASNSNDNDSNEDSSSDDDTNSDEVVILPIPEPVIILPNDISSSFATSTITFSGTSIASSTVEAVYLLSFTTTTATTTTTDNLTWSMDLLFDIGTTTVSFTTITDTGTRSSSTDIILNVTLSDVASTTEQILPDAPVILTPDFGAVFTSTTVLFSGTASSTDVISTDFNLATTTADSAGAWELVLDDFTQGITTISFVATDTSGATSTATSTDIFVDSIAPNMGNVIVDECVYTVSEDKEVCLIPILTLNASWSLFSGSSDFDYYELDLNGVISITTATSTQITILPEDITNPQNNLHYSISVTAIDKVGNRSGMSGERIEIAPSPIVINEIAWAGRRGASSDEWIELVNTTPHPVSLSGITLYAGDGSPNIEFSTTSTISRYGYYLIERKNGSDSDEATESAIVDVVADTWTSFGAGLKNSGEVLTLSYFPSDGSISVPIIFDTTPLVGDCGGWCGGEASPLYISMERIDQYVAGTDKDNWKYNSTITVNGLDINGEAINGTPRAENSPVGEIDDEEGSDSDESGDGEDEDDPFFGVDIIIFL